MDLYFSPLACSMATRIALYEAGGDARYIAVDSKTKLTAEGEDFRQIHPLGLVPVIRTDDGQTLSENAAILQWVAARFPQASLAPREGLAAHRLQQWLCFIGTELHKGVFVPLLDPGAPAPVKAYAMSKVDSRFAYLDAQLAGRECLLERFSVADAYLITVLNWKMGVGLDYARWPAVDAYFRRTVTRPAVARALAEEMAMYLAERREAALR